MWTLYSLIVALFSPLYLYSDDLEIVLFAVCMSLHEPFLVWKVVNGQHVSVTMLKVKVYFRGRSCTWISLSLHRGGGWIQIKRRVTAVEVNDRVLTDPGAVKFIVCVKVCLFCIRQCCRLDERPLEKLFFFILKMEKPNRPAGFLWFSFSAEYVIVLETLKHKLEAVFMNCMKAEGHTAAFRLPTKGSAVFTVTHYCSYAASAFSPPSKCNQSCLHFSWRKTKCTTQY